MYLIDIVFYKLKFIQINKQSIKINCLFSLKLNTSNFPFFDFKLMLFRFASKSL